MDKWIKVNTPYSGHDTNGLVVQVGVYPVGAPELYGSIEGIIEHGAAEWVDAPESDDVQEAGTTEDAVEIPQVSLTELTNKEIREQLELLGIDHSAAKNKADLLALHPEAGE